MITTIPKSKISAEKQDAYVAKAMALNLPFGNVIIASGEVEELREVFEIVCETLCLHDDFNDDLVKNVAIVNYNKTTDEG